MRLQSYVSGEWQEGGGRAAVLRDASTGAVVAEAASEGLDFAAALAHAREVGGPALRAMTFRERAAMLRAIGKRLLDFKPEFYALSHATGATRGDSWIDIDGAVGRLSKGGSCVGQHVGVPLEGAAVHIDAFNFPVWGMLEKLAPALLAGVPAIGKPATSTSYLTELVVRRIVEIGLLPAGALQLICGGVGDLFDHLGCQDVVSFTGSTATAAKLRTHPAVVRHAVRFVAETDSLNSSILGPDAGPVTPEFQLFVQEVAREMTVKAGQKCTAIRKAIVPKAWIGEVVSALQAKLAETVVGDPRTPGVGMGPLASVAQRDEVLEIGRASGRER